MMFLFLNISWIYLSNLILILDRGPLVYQLYRYVPPSLNKVVTYLFIQNATCTSVSFVQDNWVTLPEAQFSKKYMLHNLSYKRNFTHIMITISRLKKS